MKTNETTRAPREAPDGGELTESWTRAKRHVSRGDFEKLSTAAMILE